MFNTTIKPLAIILEELARRVNMHVALTGGQLYKSGTRKDVDFIIYHERGKSIDDQELDFECFIRDLRAEGFGEPKLFGFCTKTTYNGYAVDILYPEFDIDGTYPVPDAPDASPTPPPLVSFPLFPPPR